MDKKSEHPQPEANQKVNSGSNSLGRLIMLLRRLERQPHTFGQAGKLTPSDIHTIDAIGLEGTMLMSELASRLGVTKGAITQLIDKLQAKALVTRSPHPQDSRSSIVSLTELGKEAYVAHEAMHLAYYEQLRTQLSEQEIEVFEKSIDILNTVLHDMLNH